MPCIPPAAPACICAILLARIAASSGSAQKVSYGQENLHANRRYKSVVRFYCCPRAVRAHASASWAVRPVGLARTFGIAIGAQHQSKQGTQRAGQVHPCVRMQADDHAPSPPTCTPSGSFIERFGGCINASAPSIARLELDSRPLCISQYSNLECVSFPFAFSICVGGSPRVDKGTLTLF